MARKKLLSEGEVRQFMKLANLGPLSENYFTNNPLEEESEEESELHATEDELGAEDHFADEEGDELDALEDEAPVEDDLGGGDSEGLVMSLLQAVQDWAEEQGVEMDLEGDEGGEEIEAAELDVEEEPLDALPGEDEIAFSAEEEEEEEVVPGNAGQLYEKEGETTATGSPLSEDDVVAEVARRVAARLKADDQKEKMAEQLAERIFSRLTSK